MELKSLYHDLIVDHSKTPRNFGNPTECTHSASGHNPICGDEVTVYLMIHGNTIEDVKFDGHGCAISTASASLMTDAIKGKTLTQTHALFESLHQCLTASADETTAGTDLGKLGALEGVKQYPMRVKCATLAWHTLLAALDQSDEQTTTKKVTTE
ncbi:MAG: SUF system NifU family Fe-S cluster assembly protein [Gammaproteobacteria bacterium]|nr:SUF system NifU family Fe-S cluster assembly protein [Gammaproteobacteria bacterium]